MVTSIGEVEGLHDGGYVVVAVVALAEDFEGEVQLGVGVYGYHAVTAASEMVCQA